MKRSIICWVILLTLGVAIDAQGGSNSTPKLTDPLATPETKALYRNLHKEAAEGVLFGHEDTLAYGVGWKSTEKDFDSDVYRACGKFPAVFGWISAISAHLRTSMESRLSI